MSTTKFEFPHIKEYVLWDAIGGVATLIKSYTEFYLYKAYIPLTIYSKLIVFPIALFNGNWYTGKI